MVKHSDAIVFNFMNQWLIGQISVSIRLVCLILPLKYLFTKANQSQSFVTQPLIGQLNPVNLVSSLDLIATAYLHWHSPII